MLRSPLTAHHEGVAMDAIAISTVKFAADTAKVAMDRADQANKADVDAILGYFDAARIAIWGLGQEREAILSDAATCDLANEQQVDALEKRLDQYLRVNILRPHLELAIVGLDACQKIAKQHNEPFWFWPFRDKDKNTALVDVMEQHKGLGDFLNILGNRVNHSDPSGIGWQQLMDIETALKDRNRDVFENAVQAARKDASNREWLNMTLKMVTVGINLREAFR
jgi:hypothetical protein